MNATLRALNGFGLGARAGERQRIGDRARLAPRAVAGRCAGLARAGRRLAGARLPMPFARSA